MDTAEDCTDKGHRPDYKYSYRLKGRAKTKFWNAVREVLTYVVSAARDGAASAANSALRADTTLIVPVRSAADGAGAAAPAGAPNIVSESGNVLKSGLDLKVDSTNLGA